jgi:hypothetical protein
MDHRKWGIPNTLSWVGQGLIKLLCHLATKFTNKKRGQEEKLGYGVVDSLWTRTVCIKEVIFLKHCVKLVMRTMRTIADYCSYYQSSQIWIWIWTKFVSWSNFRRLIWIQFGRLIWIQLLKEFLITQRWVSAILVRTSAILQYCGVPNR